MSYIPGSTRIIEQARSDLAIGAAPRDDNAGLPLPTLDQRRNRMSEVNLMRAARQPMQDDKHRPLVVGAHSLELVVGEVRRPRGQGRVGLLLVLGISHGEVHDEAAVELGVVRLEYPPLVV